MKRTHQIAVLVALGAVSCLATVYNVGVKDIGRIEPTNTYVVKGGVMQSYNLYDWMTNASIYMPSFLDGMSNFVLATSGNVYKASYNESTNYTDAAVVGATNGLMRRSESNLYLTVASGNNLTNALYGSMLYYVTNRVNLASNTWVTSVHSSGWNWFEFNAIVMTGVWYTNTYAILKPPPPAWTTDVLIVAGGGSSGANDGASPAGGGGGVVYWEGFLIVSNTVDVVIGAGGARPTGIQLGNNGENSSITYDGVKTLISIGGGGGGGPSYPVDGAHGGCGGGGGYAYGLGGTAQFASVEARQHGHGFDGGTGGDQSGAHGTGGGGGAGEVGSNGQGGVGFGGKGGDGFACSITGSEVHYGGGGGGGTQQGDPPGVGGIGGGGGGSNYTGPACGTNGVDYLGGGSGGGADFNAWNNLTSDLGNGGIGVVVFRYRTSEVTCSGGTETTDGDFTVHTFTSSGTLTKE